LPAGLINHDLQYSENPTLLRNGQGQQLLGDKATLLPGGDVKHIRKKQIGVTLQRVCEGDKGIEFRGLEATFDIADIFGR